MRSHRRQIELGLVLLALLCGGDGAVAQEDVRPVTVTGRVFEVPSGRPVVGAFVTIHTEDGERVAGSLANDEGRYAMRVEPGRYRLMAQRIGVATVQSDLFDAVSGRVVALDLTVRSEVIDLEGVSVSGEARCRIDDDGGASRIWDLARRALDVAAWSDEMGMYEYTSEQWRRQYGANGRAVLTQESRTETRVGQQAFRSLPADTLALRGYVQGDDDDRYFYAPDASVLLSDSFLDTHCFRAVRDDDRLGLAFEPTPGRDVSDIEGTIWLSETGMLDRVEYGYVNLEGILGTARTRGGFRAVRIGGVVRFEGLPGGGWIVRDWNIRMPMIGIEVDRSGEEERRFLSGIMEVGAEVVSAEAREESLSFGGSRGAVRGVVLDSVGGRGLDRAVVYLTGAGYSSTTAADGSFLIEGVLPGIYELVVEHPLRGELGASPETVEVEATPGDVVDVGRVAFPSRAEVLTARCEGHAVIELEGGFQRTGEIAVVGGILLGADGSPVANGRVRVRWSREVEVDGIPEWRGIEVSTDERGAWFVCGVPDGVDVNAAPVTGDEDEANEGTPFRMGRVEPGSRIWITLRSRTDVP